ncbi:uncharacterized protein [Macrobrachium rosenbergii]|uniref:uncharacterized protein n=1 Tax=Macrobrachium rosenbergii TaxID=79674 RepID=UPI0034D6D786
MATHWILAVFLVLVPVSNALPEVNELDGEADFRSIRLHWKYDRAVSGRYHFIVTYCEDQSWGKYRCKKQEVKESNSIQSTGSDKKYRVFETVISGLRMSTNYTLEVTPVLEGESSNRGRAFGREIIIRTKGFSARATNCLANSSVVEVETGPHFGGKISVEGTEDPRCSTKGERDSMKTSYLLNIDHNVCGSDIQNTSVQTFIIVQENLPILTHSTRRFLVMCNYVPETFTVRAGVNLPEDINNVGDGLSPVDHSIFEVDPSELFDSANNLFDSRLSEEVGRALKMSAGEKNKEPKMWAHLVIMVILVMAAVVGLSCAVWHFARHARTNNRQGFMSPQEEPRAIEETSSMEAVVRDYSTGDTAPTCVENPVALFQTSFMTGPETASENLYDLRDDLDSDQDLEDLCRPPAVESQIINDLEVDLPGLGVTDLCQLSVHDLNVIDIPNVHMAALPDSLCFDAQGHIIDLGQEEHMLEAVGHPVETFNPLPIIVGQSPDIDPLTFDPLPIIDLPPSPFADEFPLPPDIYHSPNSSIIVLDPLALHHQSMLHLPAPLLEEELMVGPCPPPMSLQHVPQAYFEDTLPQGIILDEEDDDVFESSSDGEGEDLPGDPKFQEGDEEEEEEEEESVFDRHLNDEDREIAISRHPSLDQNWKLGDGEGQLFPAFSQ